MEGIDMVPKSKRNTIYMHPEHLKPIGSGFGSWYKEHS